MPKEWTDALALLPDENGAVHLADGLGLVRAAELDLAQSAADMMHAPLSDGPDVLAVVRRTRQMLDQGHTAQWRGLLAFALLADTWKEPCELETVRYDAATSPMSPGILAAAGQTALHLLVLRVGDRRALLGLVDVGIGLAPAAQPERLDELLPARVTWYDRTQGVFADPIKWLNQRDRRRLAARLRLLGGKGPMDAFARELEQADAAMAQTVCLDDEWETRLRAAVLLSKEPAFADVLVQQVEAYRDVRTDNPILTALGLRESSRLERPEQVTWLWEGLPFARTCEQIGLEPIPAQDATVLARIRAEELRLQTGSAQYCRDLPERIGRYLLSRGVAFVQPARDKLGDWQAQAREALGHIQGTLELCWPWPEHSPAVRLLLEENLGPALAECAAAGLSDRLTLMQGGSMDDSLLDQVCGVELGEEHLVALPPLSAPLAEHASRFGWTGAGLMADCIRLQAGADSSVTASVLLVGKGNVRITRTYRPDEQERWGAQDVPQIALWPSVPLESARWKQYFLSVQGRADVGLLDRGAWVLYRNEEGRRVVRTDSFPACVSLHRGGLCLGALLAQAPIFHPEDRGEMIGALDVGASGIGMALHVGGQMMPVEVPSLWRVMLRGDVPLLTAEPLPVWPQGPVLAANAALFGDEPEPHPFVDGRVAPNECLEDASERDKVNYDLLWRTDEMGRRARRLLIRQALLLTCFHGVMNGAQSVRWRVALPSAVSETGRSLILEEVRDLTKEASWETGLPLTGYAAEGMRGADAMGLWLRDSGLRTSFAMLDIGAGSASASVWLRGVDRPVAAFDLGSGIPAQLVMGLSEHPDKLREDFAGFSGMPVAELALGLEKSATSMRAWEKSRLLLDQLLGAHLPETAQWMNAKCAAGKMTEVQALMVLNLAGLMTCVGMMLEKLFRNPVLNDHLPQDLQLCLCGRGSLLLSTLDETLRYQLTRFLRLAMSGSHPVRSIRLTMAGAPHLEAVQALCKPAPLPVVPQPDDGPAIAPTAVAVKYFLMHFNLCFPQAAALLFPGMFGAGSMLSPTAEAAVDAMAARVSGTDAEQLMSCINALRRS